MSKIQWKPSALLYPVPVCMVSCQGKEGKPNIITIAWTGIINSDPPMVYISVRKNRYSYELIKETNQFVINLVTEKLLTPTDFCGVRSGRDIDKFDGLGLTAEKSLMIDAPGIAESPVSLECIVKQVIELGSHDMFIAEIVSVSVDEKLINKDGKLQLDKANLVCYSHGEYFNLSECIGFFGYSVAKKKKVKRTSAKKAVKKNKK